MECSHAHDMPMLKSQSQLRTIAFRHRIESNSGELSRSPLMQLGLFSISYGGLWGQATLDLNSFIPKAAELGFDAVMLAGKRPHLSPLDMDARALANLA